MFEVGMKYQIQISEQLGDRNYIYGEVLAYEGTLLKIRVGNEERILNTAAPSFVEASKSKYRPQPAPSRIYMDDEPTA